FHRVLEDLESAGDGYRLLPLTRPIPMDGLRADARDFLIRAEEHGVPQARHRVIILGVRSDLAGNLPVGQILLGRPQVPISVNEARNEVNKIIEGLNIM
ncbi:MAG: DNA (cytosine-5-)-methyltransferase, partial [Alphaproteobacteria bacterium]